MAHVSLHAAGRYVERVAPDLTLEQARLTILAHASAIDCAAAFGAKAVRIANGARLVLQGDVVTTIKMPPARQPASRTMLKRYHRRSALSEGN